MGPGRRDQRRPARLVAAAGAASSFLETHWDQPDEGIWEVRGPRRHFMHSKVMAWVAVDRAVPGRPSSGLTGPVEQWRELAATRSTTRCATRATTSAPHLHAVLRLRRSSTPRCCMIPLVGFLPADDPRVVSHRRGDRAGARRRRIRARYQPPPANRASTGCPAARARSWPARFWLADHWQLIGRRRRGARAVRAAARPAQRRRPARRGVRPAATGAMVGQLPAGVQPRPAHPDRAQPGGARARPLPAARRAHRARGAASGDHDPPPRGGDGRFGPAA